MRGNMTMVFVDLEKAVDTVPRRLAIAQCNSNITLNHVIQGQTEPEYNVRHCRIESREPEHCTGPHRDASSQPLSGHQLYRTHAGRHVHRSHYINPKKDKDNSLPSNHRGITVASTIEKVFENVYLFATEQTSPTPPLICSLGLALLALLIWPQSLVLMANN